MCSTCILMYVVIPTVNGPTEYSINNIGSTKQQNGSSIMQQSITGQWKWLTNGFIYQTPSDVLFRPYQGPFQIKQSRIVW